MNLKNLVLVLIATGCGFVAMLGILQAQPESQKQESPKIRVLVAMTDIPTGVELTGDNVQFIEMPIESVPEDAVTSREQYEQHAAKFAVMAGDTIRQSRLAMKDESTNRQIPPDMRVISISVNDTHTLSGRLRSGDRVDLLVTFQAPNMRGDTTTKTKTLLEYVEVFATDDRTIGDVTRSQENKAHNVSLLVTPEQVDYIRLAESRGPLALSLRTPGCSTPAINRHFPRTVEELERALPMQ